MIKNFKLYFSFLGNFSFLILFLIFENLSQNNKNFGNNKMSEINYLIQQIVF